MYKKKFVKRPYKKRAIKRTLKGKGKQLATKSQLYKAIRRNEETKLVSSISEAAFTLFNSAISSAG